MVAKCKREKGLKWYWFSFSFQGESQGVCNVEAANGKKALQKTIELGIHPKHDDIVTCEIREAELPPDKLHTKNDMKALGYESVSW